MINKLLANLLMMMRRVVLVSTLFSIGYVASFHLSKSSNNKVNKIKPSSLHMTATCDRTNTGTSAGAFNYFQEVARPGVDEYERVDLSFMRKNEFMVNNHAVHESLIGSGLIEVYEVYRKKDADEVMCLIKIGGRLNGYPGIVHGGITALLFDNSFGWLFIALKAPHGVTANLNINYTRPVVADSWLKLTAKMDKLEGRKLHMSATITDLEDTVLADCTTLFITPKVRHNNDATSRIASNVAKWNE